MSKKGKRKKFDKEFKQEAIHVDHKKVERIMRENGIRSKTKRKFKEWLDGPLVPGWIPN